MPDEALNSKVVHPQGFGLVGIQYPITEGPIFFRVDVSKMENFRVSVGGNGYLVVPSLLMLRPIARCVRRVRWS